MTVSSAVNKVSFNGNGSQTVFAYSFKIFDQNDLTVILRNASGGETVQAISTKYTVSGVGNANGGNVTMVTAPASGESLTIIREQPLTQGLDLVANDPFPAASFEDQLDKITFMVQQHQEELDRSVKGSKTTTITNPTFTEDATARANKVFAFDASGDIDITQEIGVYKGNWASGTTYAVRDLVKDTSTNNIFIAITAHTSSGSQPLTTNTDSAKWALVVDAASATASQNAAASSATAAATSATAAATSATASATSATASATSATNSANSATNSASSATSAAASAAVISPVQNEITTISQSIATLNGLAAIFSGTTNITVTVVNDGGTNKFAINGATAPALTLVQGHTYTFDVSDSSVSGHPLAFKDSGGSAFTTGVTTNGTAGSSGATVVIAVPSTGTMPARYYCTSHGNAMGNTIATQTSDIKTVADNSANITTVASNIATISQKATVDEATALAIALGG